MTFPATFPALTTERLRLRALTPADVDALFVLFRRPGGSCATGAGRR